MKQFFEAEIQVISPDTYNSTIIEEHYYFDEWENTKSFKNYIIEDKKGWHKIILRWWIFEKTKHRYTIKYTIEINFFDTI